MLMSCGSGGSSLGMDQMKQAALLMPTSICFIVGDYT